MGESIQTLERRISDAAWDASRIRDALWAAQMVLLHNPDLEVDPMALSDRVSNLMDLVIARAAELSERLEAASLDLRRHQTNGASAAVYPG